MPPRVSMGELYQTSSGAIMSVRIPLRAGNAICHGPDDTNLVITRKRSNHLTEPPRRDNNIVIEDHKKRGINTLKPEINRGRKPKVSL